MIAVKSQINDHFFKDLCSISSNELSNIKNSNILITGGNGFIAYYLTMSLLCHNDVSHSSNRIFLLIRNKEHTKKLYKNLLGREDIVLITQDVNEPLGCNYKFDYILHAATSADSKYFDSNPLDVFYSSVRGIENIIEYVKKQPCQSIVLFSSFTVYGQIDETLSEIDENYCGRDPWNTKKSIYSYGKKCAELFSTIAVDRYNSPIKIVRPGFVYGFNPSFDSRVYSEIINTVSYGQDVILKSAGYVYRPMIYVTDLIRGVFLVMSRGVNGSAYNITSKNASIREFASTAVEISKGGSNLLFERESDKTAIDPVNHSISISTKKIENDCGWHPKFDLRNGIEMSIINSKCYLNGCGLDNRDKND